MATGTAEQKGGGGNWPAIFTGLLGSWLGLALVKFGNPVILDRMIEPPAGFLEFMVSPWPVAWGYFMLLVLVLASLPIVRFTTSAPAWVVVLPLVWLGWQLIAAAQTVDAALTRATVLHFIACVSSFYVGLFALNRMNRSKSFWIMILVGFAWVLWIGFDQHFGGLEATRRWFFEQPNWQEYPSEYLKRIASDRIFSTLVYPNALAGAILLFLPPLLMFTFDLTERVHRIVRGVFVGLLGYAGLACLYWSGSKAGWLIAMVLAVIVLLRLPVERKVKLAVISAALFVGILGFSLKFSNYFQKGATSVGARFDYWRAALVVAKEHPILGTGPGTFSIPYKRIKASDSEMTKLVHNNYLEQASDSGVPGFLAFAWIVFGSIWMLYRKCAGDDLRFAVWLGSFAWALQGFVEFNLYIPALAWPAFLLLGWLWGTNAK